MKKILPGLIVLLSFPLLSSANSFDNYHLDDNAIDVLFNSSNDISYISNTTGNVINDLGMKIPKIAEEGDRQMIGGIIALASWITGIGILIPFHRFYLGTGGQPVKIFFLYFCTLSGFGFITLIDGIVLLMDPENGKFIENPRFIMW